MTIRILIADDHILFRSGLHALLNARDGFEIVGEVSDGGKVLTLAKELRPDVVLMDINMSNMDGTKVNCLLKRELPDVKVLILTLHADIKLLEETIRVGASGYILKRALKSELIDAIITAYRGDLYIHHSVRNDFLQTGDT